MAHHMLTKLLNPNIGIISNNLLQKCIHITECSRTLLKTKFIKTNVGPPVDCTLAHYNNILNSNIGITYNIIIT